MSTLVLGIGGRGHRDWAIAPRVIARLAADPWVRAHDVRLMVAPRLPGHPVSANGVRRLIVVRVGCAGVPGRIQETIVDVPTGRVAPYGPLVAACGADLVTLADVVQLPGRTVVLTVGGCDLRPGRTTSPGMDEVVRRVVSMVRGELALPIGRTPAGQALLQAERV